MHYMFVSCPENLEKKCMRAGQTCIFLTCCVNLSFVSAIAALLASRMWSVWSSTRKSSTTTSRCRNTFLCNSPSISAESDTILSVSTRSLSSATPTLAASTPAPPSPCAAAGITADIDTAVTAAAASAGRLLFLSLPADSSFASPSPSTKDISRSRSTSLTRLAALSLFESSAFAWLRERCALACTREIRPLLAPSSFSLLLNSASPLIFLKYSPMSSSAHSPLAWTSCQ
mmetsp:Transcript_22124/g.50853  ORF Transcript_22124/g.50853 Transcript_22124/m.50853 type:complete len:230 (-) Transcript_22124:169-858(-)